MSRSGAQQYNDFRRHVTQRPLRRQPEIEANEGSNNVFWVPQTPNDGGPRAPDFEVSPGEISMLELSLNWGRQIQHDRHDRL
jgi:hypothetical protein